MCGGERLVARARLSGRRPVEYVWQGHESIPFVAPQAHNWCMLRLRFRRIGLSLVASALLGTFAIVGPVHAEWPIAPIAPDVQGQVPVGTPVGEMPPQIAEAYIRGIQEELAGHGYAPGPADGLMGARTRAAIEQYQRDAGLPETGAATKEILDHLLFTLPKINAASGQQNVGSSLTLSVQEQLIERGYGVGRVDGVAGPETIQAVRQFQKDAGLPVTGVIDGLLLDELRTVDPSIPDW